MRMPFGKFKGLPVESLPPQYLKWLYENVELRSPLLEAVSNTLANLDSSGAGEPNKIKKVYRELAKKWHPDLGGSTEAMKAINEFYEKLGGRNK